MHDTGVSEARVGLAATYSEKGEWFRRNGSANRCKEGLLLSKGGLQQPSPRRCIGRSAQTLSRCPGCFRAILASLKWCYRSLPIEVLSSFSCGDGDRMYMVLEGTKSPSKEARMAVRSHGSWCTRGSGHPVGPVSLTCSSLILRQETYTVHRVPSCVEVTNNDGQLKSSMRDFSAGVGKLHYEWPLGQTYCVCPLPQRRAGGG